MADNREESDDYRAIVARLSDDWRVIVCRAGIQWIIQRRAGSPRHGADRWLSVSFPRHRDGLAQLVKERCGTIRPEAMVVMQHLPAIIDADAHLSATAA